MSRPEGCKCDFHTYMVGDGCEVCNPAKALEYAKGTIEDLAEEIQALKARVEELEAERSRQQELLDFYERNERL